MTYHAPPPAAVPSAHSWRRIVLAAAVLAFLGASAGTALGLTRSKNDGGGGAVTAQPTPSVSTTQPPTESASPPCTSECPTTGPTTGYRTTSVPHVVGHDEAGARKRLQDRDLNAQVRYTCADEGAAGTVTAQNPHGDTQVRAGSNVSLEVRGVSVQNVVGQYHGDAKHILETAGLTVVVNHRQPGAAGGSVSSQSPGANSCVKPGSTVTITVGQPTTSASAAGG